MAKHIVTGDQYRTIDRRMREIKRMLDQKNGSPLDPEEVAEHLQRIIDQPSSIIDCSLQPMIPEGWSIREEDQIKSRFQGELIWSPEKIGLHLDEAQKTGSIVGNELRKKLEGQPVLPAKVLDYLLAHPALIPPDWKGKYVYFWGSVYRRSDGNASVRCLYWGDRGWYWLSYRLGHYWGHRDPGAVLAG
ncbi:hypothetical protein EPO33_05305 [Patescibacteria group bacterium]|nr:MAG: hypothetical protein EPO33_05305 [Patescibacteria group bacterium]